MKRKTEKAKPKAKDEKNSELQKKKNEDIKNLA